jgi:C4-dicarboxylate transporter DctM subunit
VPPITERTTLGQKLYASRNLIPIVLLIALVLGSIYIGVATATEAAALGVVGSLVLASFQKSLSWQSFRDSLMGATRLYCMIALILAGSSFLTLSMGYLGLPRQLAEWIGSLGLTPFWLLFGLMFFYIILGCFLDGISMVVLTIGVIQPTIMAAGIDLIWFGVFLVVVVEMAQITPPVGFNLFVLQGMTKQQLPWIARTAMPAFFLMMAAVGLLYAVPGLVTWLPQRMVG